MYVSFRFYRLCRVSIWPAAHTGFRDFGKFIVAIRKTIITGVVKIGIFNEKKGSEESLLQNLLM